MATAGVPLWSTTASNNSTADPAVNFAEGMSASAVNDSGRALMASVAKWRDDLYGITTSGTSTAYTITTGSTFATAAAMSGVIFTIIPHTTSGASPTLAVDGLTARALNVSTGVAVPTGALVSGTPYLVKYVHASTEFIVLGGVGALGNTTITGTLSVSDGMTLSGGQYTSPVGSVGAPTYSFVGDLDCGVYRIGANNIGIAVNGTKIVDVATTGLTIVGTISATAFSVTLPTTQIFTSGSGTYTTPANVRYIRVKAVGGGGGGGGSGTGTSAGNGGAGGTTTFNSVNANGGSGGTKSSSGGGGPGGAGGTGGTGTATRRIIGGYGGGGGNSDVQGGQGGSSMLGGNGGGGESTASVSPGKDGATNTGGGGGGASGISAVVGSGGGGGGGEAFELVIGSPASTYAYSVGAAGTAGSAGTSGSAGGAGGSGVIVVEEYYV